MYPVCIWLERHGWSKSLAITGCLLIVTILFAALSALLVCLLNEFGKDAPAIFEKLGRALQELQTWMSVNFGVTADFQNIWKERFPSIISNMLKPALETTVNTLFILFLIPVFTALFMYHRKTFVQFLKMITPAGYRQQADIILHQIIHTYFNFIKGMVLVYIIVGILNSIGLLALGVKHALLYGMLCAIMTIIPYVGIFVSAMLPVSVAWLETGNVWYPLGVIAVFSFVQYLEQNVIFPKVVGIQLQVNTLAMLVTIIAGGIIWGVAGMILFIPLVAILKIISDNIEEWKPLNLLLSRK